MDYLYPGIKHTDQPIIHHSDILKIDTIPLYMTCLNISLFALRRMCFVIVGPPTMKGMH